MIYKSPYQKALDYIKSVNNGDMDDKDQELFTQAKSSGYNEEQATQILASAKMRSREKDVSSMYDAYKQSPTSVLSGIKKQYEKEGGAVGKGLGFLWNTMVDVPEAVFEMGQFAAGAVKHGVDLINPFDKKTTGQHLKSDAAIAKAIPKAVMTALKENFGDGKWKETFYENPFDVLSTLIPVVGQVGKVGKASKVASIAKAGAALEKVAGFSDLSKLKSVKDASKLNMVDKTLNQISKLGNLTDWDINTLKAVMKSPDTIANAVMKPASFAGMGNTKAFENIASRAATPAGKAGQQAVSGMDMGQMAQLAREELPKVKTAIAKELDPFEEAARNAPQPLKKSNTGETLFSPLNQDSRMKSLGVRVAQSRDGKFSIIEDKTLGSGARAEIPEAQKALDEMQTEFFGKEGVTDIFDYKKMDNFRDALERRVEASAGTLAADIFEPMAQHIKKVQGKMYPEVQKVWDKLTKHAVIEDNLNEALGRKFTQNLKTGKFDEEKAPPNPQKLIDMVKKDPERFKETVKYISDASGGKLNLEDMAYALQGQEWFGSKSLITNAMRIGLTSAAATGLGIASEGSKLAMIVGATAVAALTSPKIIYNLAKVYGNTKGGLAKIRGVLMDKGGLTSQQADAAIKTIKANKSTLDELDKINVGELLKNAGKAGWKGFSAPVSTLKSAKYRRLEQLGQKLINQVKKDMGMEEIQGELSDIQSGISEMDASIGAPAMQETAPMEEENTSGIHEYPEALGTGNY